MKLTAKVYILLKTASVIILSSCSHEPADIRFGEEECAHCRMIISDAPFAAQMITDKGRHFKFDAIECLAAYQIKEPYAPAEVQYSYVPYFDDPEIWLEAEEAWFLKSDKLPSPMGLHFSAYPDEGEAEQFRSEFEGEIYQWESVKEIVNREWFED